MNYIDGMICAVPTADRETYIEHARKAGEVFKKHGALGVTECWGDEIPEGETNSLHTAVMRKPDETVVLSWIAWPSKEVRDAAWPRVMEDPAMGELPFDGSRLIHGGFEVIVSS